jgi:hypothetical protein
MRKYLKVLEQEKEIKKIRFKNTDLPIRHQHKQEVVEDDRKNG